MKKIALILAILMALFCFTACGNNDSAKDSSKTSGDDNETVITVGYTIYAPMNYLDESGKLIGFDTELAEQVFENLGYKVIFKEINWNNKYTELSSGNVDCLWNGFTANTADDDGVARSEKVDFSYNYMENRQVVVIKEGTAISAAADLSGKLGAAESGSAGETYGQEFEGATVKGVSKQTDALLEVNTGAVDFAVVDAQLAESYCGKGDYAQLSIVEALTSDVEYYAIGFKKGSDLTAKVNAQLEALAKDGSLLKLAEKYGMETSVLTDFSNQK